MKNDNKRIEIRISALVSAPRPLEIPPPPNFVSYLFLFFQVFHIGAVLLPTSVLEALSGQYNCNLQVNRDLSRNL